MGLRPRLQKDPDHSELRYQGRSCCSFDLVSTEFQLRGRSIKEGIVIDQRPEWVVDVEEVGSLEF